MSLGNSFIPSRNSRVTHAYGTLLSRHFICKLGLPLPDSCYLGVCHPEAGIALVSSPGALWIQSVRAAPIGDHLLVLCGTSTPGDPKKIIRLRGDERTPWSRD